LKNNIPNNFIRSGNETVAIRLNGGINSIGNNAFYSTKITQMTISEFIKRIGDYAFYQSLSLKGIMKFTDLSYLGANAFNSTKITSFEISGTSSITDIFDYTFNACQNYTYIQADANKYLIEIGNQAELGTNIALGYHYYDRKTGELLPEKRKLETGNILEVWNYDDITNKESENYNSNQVFTAGEMILKSGKIYKVLLTHWLYQVTDSNFDTFYQAVANLDDVLGGSIPEWKHPAGAHDAYMKGAKVMYNGKTYVSTEDNNVWAPGVYGWDLVN